MAPNNAEPYIRESLAPTPPEIQEAEVYCAMFGLRRRLQNFYIRNEAHVAEWSRAADRLQDKLRQLIVKRSSQLEKAIRDSMPGMLFVHALDPQEVFREHESLWEMLKDTVDQVKWIAVRRKDMEKLHKLLREQLLMYMEFIQDGDWAYADLGTHEDDVSRYQREYSAIGCRQLKVIGMLLKLADHQLRDIELTESSDSAEEGGAEDGPDEDEDYAGEGAGEGGDSGGGDESDEVHEVG